MKKRIFPYIILTSLLMLATPSIVLVLLVIVMGLLEFLGTVGAFIVGAVLISGLSFLWGFLFTAGDRKYPENPRPLGVIYLPAFIPLISDLLIHAVLYGIYGSDFLMHGFSLNLITIWVALMGGSVLMYSLPSDAAMIVGFVLGERLRAKKLGIKRAGIKGKTAGIWSAAAAAVLCCSLGFGHYADLSRVTSSDYTSKDFYNDFPYEHGWSSIDLLPYYVDNADNILAKPDSEPTFRISGEENFPVLDGAEAAYPVYSAFALSCYEDIAAIQAQRRTQFEAVADYRSIPENLPVRFTNTIQSFKDLVSGSVDIYFGARPSAAQTEMAEKAGKTLVLTPIGKEAFVFFVNEDNPVDGLTSEQIRDIYSGKITNWRELGGGSVPILAFQRPENSGSQTMMQYFMGDTPLKEPLKAEYVAPMMGTLTTVAGYQNKRSAVGYSFRYYAQEMGGGTAGIKLLSLDGVSPDREHIASGEYPMTTTLYAITLAENDNEYIAPMLEWITGEQGQEIVEKTGYVSVD